MYTFDKVAKTCETHPLSGKLEPYCLASNATHIGQITLGGRMKCDVWEENMFGFQIRLVISSTQYIPVNLISRGGHQDALFQEWFDYTNGVNDPTGLNSFIFYFFHIFLTIFSFQPTFLLFLCCWKEQCQQL